MKMLTSKKIDNILKQYPLENFEDNVINGKKKDLEKELNKYIEKKAVIGIDIYRYSQYSNLPQILVPRLFKYLYEITINNCTKLEPYIFKNLDIRKIKTNFIDTGDGGFQIFDNPFQAVIFAIYFQSNIFRYNSIHSSSIELFRIIDEITLRYSLTFDSVYSYENNFYGPSIINCSRIMSKDKLNRFLIDENTKKWFTKEFNGIENLQVINIDEDSNEINILKKKNNNEKISSVIFKDKKSKILKVDLMKIGEIKSKLDVLSIHNLHIQVMMYSKSSRFKKHTISLGNLNSNGLID